MAVITIRQAKTQLSKLIARAEAGEEIIIARGREPAVKLTPIGTRVSKRASER
jgi:prevent-host-death family protein